MIIPIEDEGLGDTYSLEVEKSHHRSLILIAKSDVRILTIGDPNRRWKIHLSPRLYTNHLMALAECLPIEGSVFLTLDNNTTLMISGKDLVVEREGRQHGSEIYYGSIRVTLTTEGVNILKVMIAEALLS